jgi:hypothetical protein
LKSIDFIKPAAGAHHSEWPKSLIAISAGAAGLIEIY